jgi:hypothetical protein
VIATSTASTAAHPASRLHATPTAASSGARATFSSLIGSLLGDVLEDDSTPSQSGKDDEPGAQTQNATLLAMTWVAPHPLPPTSLCVTGQGEDPSDSQGDITVGPTAASAGATSGHEVELTAATGTVSASEKTPETPEGKKDAGPESATQAPLTIAGLSTQTLNETQALPKPNATASISELKTSLRNADGDAPQAADAGPQVARASRPNAQMPVAFSLRLEPTDKAARATVASAAATTHSLPTNERARMEPAAQPAISDPEKPGASASQGDPSSGNAKKDAKDSSNSDAHRSKTDVVSSTPQDALRSDATLQAHYAVSHAGAEPTPKSMEPKVPTAAPASPVSEPAEAERATAQPLQSIDLHLDDDAQNKVSLRLTDRGGHIEVTVRSSDSSLVRSMQGGVSQLSEKIAQQGYKVESSTTESAHSGSAEPVSSHGTETGSGTQENDARGGQRFTQGQGQAGSNGESSRERGTPAWIDQIEDSLDGASNPKTQSRNN